MSFIRARTTSSKDAKTAIRDQEQDPSVQKAPPPPSFSQRALSQTLAGTANLANLLPTGTLLAFQLLTPIFSSNGNCDTVTRLLTQVLLLMLATSCFLASFTDSCRSPDGQLYYGIATPRGMWFFDYPITAPSPPDLANYRIRFIDGVHAVLSVFVFVTVAVRDKNVLNCLYPRPEKEMQEVLDIVPVGIGLICSMLFVVFPTRRHGIGYPVTSGK